MAQPMRKLLIANRGEIAIRIARAAAEIGLATVAVFSEDDARLAAHPRAPTRPVALGGRGAGAYLDIGADRRGREGDRLRRGPSRLRLPERERRFRRGLRRRRA